MSVSVITAPTFSATKKPAPTPKKGLFGLFSRARQTANAPVTKYGLELIASKAIEKKVGEPDGILENILQYWKPKYYNAYKLSKIASQKRSMRMLALVAGLMFPRRFPALVAAAQSGGKLTLAELLGIWLAPDAVLAYNAHKKDVFTGGKTTKPGPNRPIKQTLGKLFSRSA